MWTFPISKPSQNHDWHTSHWYDPVGYFFCFGSELQSSTYKYFQNYKKAYKQTQKTEKKNWTCNINVRKALILLNMCVVIYICSISIISLFVVFALKGITEQMLIQSVYHIQDQ